MFNLDNIILNSEIFYAHKNDNKFEFLKDHIELSLKYANKIIKEKNLLNSINYYKKYFKDNSDSFNEMFFATFYFHDLGKINPDFQASKIGNKLFRQETSNSSHSLIGARIYYEYFFNKLNKESPDFIFNLYFLILNSYIISKHHTNLDDFEKFYIDLNNEFDSKINIDSFILKKEDNELIKKYIINSKLKIEKLHKNNKDFSIEIYIYSKLLYSILIACDFYSTSEFMNKKEINDFGLLNKADLFLDEFKKNEIYQKIIKYKNKENVFEDSKINKLRSELFIEAENNLLKNIDKNIFFLEAPTGSGKTNSAINLSLKLIENDKNLNKIFYVFPFNTLIEQTTESLKKTLGEENINNNCVVLNSITPIMTEDEESYEDSLLKHEFIHHPLVITSHVKFFDSLFGISRSSHFSLAQIANSVVVLDEIQAYKNNIWKKFSYFIAAFSKILNIKFVIMSATLPSLDKMVDIEECSFVSLINDRKKYFNNPVFKNRVNIDFSLLKIMKNVESKEEKFSILSNLIIQETKINKKILVEFICKKTAKEFFEYINSSFVDFNFEFLSGDDNIVVRKNIINKIKNENSQIILISTQIIEAGVDIDMDCGFKDISLLDAEEQFLGRINRSCLKNSKAYFFNIDDASKIYKNDVRIEKQFTLLETEIQEILISKDFQKYYSLIINEINKNSLRNNSDNFDSFLKSQLSPLKFKALQKELELINDNAKFRIFLNRKIEYLGEIIDGEKVWQDYKNLIKNNEIQYAEKTIKLSKINSLLDLFTYNVRHFNNSFNDNISNIYFIKDSDDYFIKFNERLIFNPNKVETQGAQYEFV